MVKKLRVTEDVNEDLRKYYDTYNHYLRRSEQELDKIKSNIDWLDIELRDFIKGEINIPQDFDEEYIKNLYALIKSIHKEIKHLSYSIWENINSLD